MLLLLKRDKLDPRKSLLISIMFYILGTLVLPVLQPDSLVAIPLRCTSWRLYMRPYGMGVGFCSQAVEWGNVLRSHTTMGCSRECFPVSLTGEAAKKFRYAFYVDSYSISVLLCTSYMKMIILWHPEG